MFGGGEIGACTLGSFSGIYLNFRGMFSVLAWVGDGAGMVFTLVSDVVCFFGIFE